jgi:hypothetical protein
MCKFSFLSLIGGGGGGGGGEGGTEGFRWFFCELKTFQMN